MRTHVYAEELNDRPEIVADTNNDGAFTGVRFNLGAQGSFGKSGKTRSENAVTLWGKGDGSDLIPLFESAIADLKQRATTGQRQPEHA